MVHPKKLLFSWCFLLLHFKLADCSKFTFVNKCGYTVWPGILSNAGSSRLPTTGFELPSGATRAFAAPSGWSGRFWGRTGCSVGTDNDNDNDNDKLVVCSTGDCGSGEVECNGAGATPPATLAEFTLGEGGGKDYYDVSLVDGYNLPMLVEAGGGDGNCPSTGCVADLNRACPAELKVGGGDACRSACEAFGKPEYCCSGAFSNPNTCRPSVYSAMFKTACPRSYSYAYDDATSTFTCVAADYAITFCPASTPSSKSSTDSDSTPNSDSNSNSNSGSNSISPPRTTTTAAATMVDNDAWIASLATGDAINAERRMHLHIQAPTIATITSILLGFLL